MAPDAMGAFHMNKGAGETSYEQNCTLQKKIIAHGRCILEDTLMECVRRLKPESMGIADLGCGPGTNSSMVILEIMDIVSSKMGSSELPELRVSLNDLPQCDFSHLFMSLPEVYDKVRKEKGIVRERCFINVVAGSFYGRLFPENSLHFVHSSSTLHWLSQVPECLRTGREVNKGNVCVTSRSSESVVKAYIDQFNNDFSLFLKSRAEEIVPGGSMVLTFMCEIPNKVGSPDWDLLGQALMSMASEGLIEEDKIDSFNIPCHHPSREEVKNLIVNEGSFTINKIKLFESEWDEFGIEGSELSTGALVSQTMRACIESMVESHFGSHVLEDLFSRFTKLYDDYMSNDGTKFVNMVISLTKKD